MSDFWSDSSSTSILLVCKQHGSGETAWVCTWAFTGHLCDKYHLRIKSWFWSFNEGMNGITDAHIFVCRHTKMCASVIPFIPSLNDQNQLSIRGARWLSGRVSDSGARGPGFETYRRRVVSLSKTLYSPKVLVNYLGSDGSVPTWLKNCWLGR